ncbi:hypothetical protein [Sorangium sp. So ce136]|uniref:hypothetical protein n=1 Tax=unclassified Sorangium TaxID=2621164 RepID=UPI003F043CDB
MGEVIRKDAPADDIIGDVRATLHSASAKGGSLRELAEQRLVPVLTLFDGVEAQRNAARSEAEPLLAKVEAESARADDALGKVADDVWNAVGRPSADPALSILFPGGVAYFADHEDGDITGQPDRLEVLAQLLGSGIHPKLSLDKAQAAAAEVKSAAAALRSTVEATRLPLERLSVLDRIRAAVAKSAHIELVHLKRLYKAAGFSEAEIHGVIPDRGRARRRL